MRFREQLRISVVIPTWNRAHCITECINSVLDQSRQADEVIVVDDGSTDGTDKILAAYQDRGVIIIRQPNFGVSAARNAAIARATGNWIAFLDSDDIWLSSRLEILARDLVRVREDVGVHIANARLVGTDYALNAFDIQGHSFSEGPATVVKCPLELAVNGIFTPTAAVRAEWLRRSGGFDTTLTLFEDLLLFSRLALLGPWAFTADIVAEVNRIEGDNDALSFQARDRPLYSAEQFLYLLDQLLEEKILPTQRRILRNKQSGALFQLAQIQATQGDRGQARQTLVKAASAHPNSWRGWVKSLIPMLLGRRGFDLISRPGGFSRS